MYKYEVCSKIQPQSLASLGDPRTKQPDTEDVSDLCQDLPYHYTATAQ